MDTYNKSCQLAASRRHLKDAEVLYDQKRWLGSVYLGGYAIECSLKAFICYEQHQENFKKTTVYRKGQRGSELHSLTKLLNSSSLKRIIQLDKTHSYQKAWDKVSTLWRNADLRYSEASGNEEDSRRFIDAAKKLHNFFLQQQGVKP
ncbi:hypothetical protein VB711_00270 [Cronbergia sp. UHCC 0137]|uniref:hypothetical protein n=1 Tax=Cronbergia sp. UHCC 0137 TaxID=3110239 RepID=UPI002B201CB9|nr:hypothetical protein [Cronbergia sp. UHCC 0137]MEA5616278.1 hypothetical protein [Cronbergia sp. UHCC 0137]